MNQLNRGLLRKQLNTRSSFNRKVMTLGQRLQRINITGKSINTVTHSIEKIDGDYKKLAKSKITYYINYHEDGTDLRLKVTKLVWDNSKAVYLVEF